MKKNLKVNLITAVFISISCNQMAHAFTPSIQKCQDDYVNRYDAYKKINHEFDCNRMSIRSKTELTMDSNNNTKFYPDVISHQRKNDYYESYLPEILSFKDDFGLDRNSCESNTTMAKYKTIVCTSDCYTGDQQVLFTSGPLEIGEQYNHYDQKVITLKAGSTLNSLNYEEKAVSYYNQSEYEADHKVLTFKLGSGGQIKVSTNHPLMTSDGLIKRASNLSVGDYLVQENGTFDEILSIDVTPYAGKLYNIEPKTENNEASIIVAQGYLSGSLTHQTEHTKYLQRLVSRDYLPDDLVN